LLHRKICGENAFLDGQMESFSPLLGNYCVAVNLCRTEDQTLISSGQVSFSIKQ
jgi:hypothetical protein